MKEKVVKSPDACLNTTTNDKQIIPSNIIISTLSTNPTDLAAVSTLPNSAVIRPPLPNTSSTAPMPLSLSSAMTSSSNNFSVVPSHQTASNALLASSPQLTKFNAVSSSTENCLSFDVHSSSSQLNIFDQHEITIDKQERSLNSRMIQSFSFNLEPIRSCISAINKSTSSPPIVAVRNVISRLLSEHDFQSSTPKHPVRSRGCRLENKFGLNITEDTLVEMKLREKQKRTIRRCNTSLQKTKRIRSTAYTRTKRFRNTAPTFECTDSEQENIQDKDIASAVKNLQNVIDYTQTQFDHDNSCNIFDFLT